MRPLASLTCAGIRQLRIVLLRLVPWPSSHSVRVLLPDTLNNQAVVFIYLLKMMFKTP